MGLAASLSLVACGGGSTCERAAEHVAACLGESPTPPAAGCSVAEAQTILSQRCEELRGGLSRSAQGLGDLLCRFAAWLCPKPREPQPTPSCGELTSLGAASCLANELEGGSWSHDSRAILTRTALLAGSPENTRKAFAQAEELNPSFWSHEGRAGQAFNAALSFADPSRARQPLVFHHAAD